MQYIFNLCAHYFRNTGVGGGESEGVSPPLQGFGDGVPGKFLKFELF